MCLLCVGEKEAESFSFYPLLRDCKQLQNHRIQVLVFGTMYFLLNGSTFLCPV